MKRLSYVMGFGLVLLRFCLTPGVIAAEKAFEPLSFFDEVGALLAEDLKDDKFIDESFEWLE